jgi:hypothetical protein
MATVGPRGLLSTCAECPHPEDCAGVGACLDTVNARARHPHCAEYMTPAQVAAVDAALDEGKSLRVIACIPGALVSLQKMRKHMAQYPAWGARAAERIERNRKLADRRKGHNALLKFCKRGHDLSVTASVFKRKEGYSHRQCRACIRLNARNPVSAPRPELVAKVKAALAAGQKVSSFTKGKVGEPGRICDFRQLWAVRAFHPEIERQIAANSAQPVIRRPSTASIIRSNLRGPTLTGIIAAPADPSYTLADQIIPRNLPPDVRRAAVGSLASALFLKEVSPEEARRAAKMFVRAAWKDEGPDLRVISLDALNFRDDAVPLVERISEARGMWA